MAKQFEKTRLGNHILKFTHFKANIERYMITLNTIIETLADKQLLVDDKTKLPKDCDAVFSRISVNSNDVGENSIFICKGNNFKEEYALQALRKGTKALLLDEKTLDTIEVKASNADDAALKNKAIICTQDIKKAMAIVCKEFYDSPDEKLKIIGVTGTKGKTTTTSFLKKIIEEQSNKPVGYIGTHHAFDGKKQVETTNTTPEAHELYKLLHNMVENDCEYCVMEVSSQALKYDRTYGLKLELAGLTNIGKDHISPIEHPDVEDYVKSKMKIFELAQTIVCNRQIALDNKKQEQLLEKVLNSSHDNNNNLVLLAPKTQDLELKMKGAFNQNNAEMALMLAKLLGFDEKTSVDAIKDYQVAGRMQIFESKNKQLIGIVDYAHTKDSYLEFFKAVKQAFQDAYLIAYFGVSGNKAENRYLELPETAAKYCDYIIITSDDPGSTEPGVLCKEVESNIPDCAASHLSIPSRDEACVNAFKHAYEIAKTRQVVVCALGKGDEDFCYCDGEDIPIIPDTKHVEMKIDEYDKMCNQ